MCDSVFPSNSDKIISWEEHYFAINKIFWVCNILCALTLIIDIEKSRHIALGEDYYILYFIAIFPWIIYSLVAYFFPKIKSSVDCINFVNPKLHIECFIYFLESRS